LDNILLLSSKGFDLNIEARFQKMIPLTGRRRKSQEYIDQLHSIIHLINNSHKLERSPQAS